MTVGRAIQAPGVEPRSFVSKNGGYLNKAKQPLGFELEPVDIVEEAHAESQFPYQDERDAIDHNYKTHPLEFSAPNGKKAKPKDKPLSAPLFLAILSTSVSAPPTYLKQMTLID
ncbi:hypothetical protein K438DRAFT_1781121 [Mycena galopus ATCC 62051]|nr:hypothetical protein K438DRAFT_1781121 [Mycena galopus ATCC 62051]